MDRAINKISLDSIEYYLNYDVFFYIFEYLDYDGMRKLCHLNSYYRNFCKNPLIQKLMIDKYIDELNINITNINNISKTISTNYQVMLGYSDEIYKLFHNEILLNHVVIIKEFIERGYHTSIYRNILLDEAISLNRLKIVRLLLQDPEYDSSYYLVSAITLASENGYLEIVKSILQYPGVHPYFYGVKPVNAASENGHIEIVKLLIQDPRVERKWVNYNEAINLARKNKHPEIVKLLNSAYRIKDSR